MSLAAILPGRPYAPFTQVEETRYVLELERPALIKELALTMTTPCVPVGHAAVCYFALPPFQEWTFVGHVSLTSPTQFLRAPWLKHIPDDTPLLQLGISIESEELVQNLAQVGELPEQKEESQALESADGIAKDLYTYMASFAQQTQQFAHLGNVLVLPVDVVDKWYAKFKAKHLREPFFWTKLGGAK